MWLGSVNKGEPAQEPITTNDARRQCRLEVVDGNPPDDELDGFIAAARFWIEQEAQIRLINQGVEMRATSWDDVLQMPLAPIAAIISIEVQAGSAPPIEVTDFQADLGGLTPSISPPPGGAWPALPAGARIVINATVGFGEDAAAVPGSIQLACKVLVSAMNDNRGAIPGDAERTARSLLGTNIRTVL